MSTDIYVDGRYAELNPAYHVEDSPWKAKQVFDMLESQAEHPTSVIEIGCGAGEVLAQLARRLSEDVRLEGWDVSPHAIALASSRSGPRTTFRVGDFLTDSDEQFDLALCLDVFEHVEDYIGFLRRLRPRAVNKIFHVPLDLSVQSVLRVSPILRSRERVGHLHHFTKETALQTLALSGYQIMAWRYTSGTLDLPDRSRLQRLARLPRRAIRAISPDLSARWFGGFSLLVFAR